MFSIVTCDPRHAPSVTMHASPTALGRIVSTHVTGTSDSSVPDSNLTLHTEGLCIMRWPVELSYAPRWYCMPCTPRTTRTRMPLISDDGGIIAAGPAAAPAHGLGVAAMPAYAGVRAPPAPAPPYGLGVWPPYGLGVWPKSGGAPYGFGVAAMPA